MLKSSKRTSQVGFFPVVGTVIRKSEPKQAILFLGAPGVGKSTQTERIVKQVPGVMCVSTGNLVRNLARKIEEGKERLNAVEQTAAESLDRMKRGELMDDDAVYALMMAHISPGAQGYEEYLRSHTIIWDGVIKAVSNIGSFEAALKTFNERPDSIPMFLHTVVSLSATKDELLSRQQARVMKALAEGIPQRPDDAPATYLKRLETYLSKTKELIEYYKARCNFIDIDSSLGIEETTASLIHVIQHESLATDTVACALRA